MIKVLIVEDSIVTTELLIYILSSDKDIEVVGTASNGEEAIEMVRDKRPDVVTMDINMPKMDGLEAIKQIMSTNPIPIIIVSSNWDTEDLESTFKAVEVGAVAFVQKPYGITHSSYKDTADKLVDMVKMMSEVRVVKRWYKNLILKNPSRNNQAIELNNEIVEPKIVVIGVSTGGPPVLQKMLKKISPNFPLPILIVQHITVGFLSGLVDWLNRTSSLPIHIATNNSLMKSGNVYFAAENFQMKVIKNNRIILTNDDDENGIKPSVSYLFRSVAEIYGKDAIGILLTGMGRDGANELLEMYEKGAVTIAQDQETSIIHGMPGEAIKLGAVKYILPPDKIVEMLEKIANCNF